MATPHPDCPIDAQTRWTLQRDASVLEEGTGLESGLRALWAKVLAAVNELGELEGAATTLELQLEREVPSGRKRVMVATDPGQRLALARLRAWALPSGGEALLTLVAQAHARVLLASPRWSEASPAPETESYTPLLLAGFIDEPNALARALKPGRH